MKNIIILLISIFIFITCGEKSTEPENEEAAINGNVLILGDEGTEDSLFTVLLNSGVKVDSGGPYYTYTGKNLSSYKVVIFLNGVEWVAVMPDSVQQKIRNFVSGGGVLFSIEWISWSGATNQIINDMLPITYGGWWDTGSEYYYKTMDHAIGESLPDTFLLPVDWSFSNTILDIAANKNAQMIFEGSRSGAAIVTGDFQSGHTIHWNMGGHYAGSRIWTAEVKKLLVNIVNYALSEAE